MKYYIYKNYFTINAPLETFYIKYKDIQYIKSVHDPQSEIDIIVYCSFPNYSLEIHFPDDFQDLFKRRKGLKDVNTDEWVDPSYDEILMMYWSESDES